MCSTARSAWSRAAEAGAAPFPLPSIPYLRLRVTLRALAPATLPAFHGSMLRGAFGHALRLAACSMGPAQPCPSCRLRRSCVHTRLFETLLDPEGGEPPPFLRGLPTAPRPYVFEPGSAARRLSPGEELPFDLLLFGQAADLWAYALLAVERMAAAGLGRARCPFALARAGCPDAADGGRDVFLEGRGLLGGEVPVERLPSPPLTPAGDLPSRFPGGPAAGSPAPALPAGAGTTRGTLTFLTPTRLKAGGRLVRSPSFRALVFAMLRRHLELAHFHVPGAAVDWTIRPLLERASGVRIAAADLAWSDWERYSNRQGTRMTLGGFTGALELEGDLAPFEPLLRGAEILHAGKGATFGLGRTAWAPRRPEP